MEQVFFFRVLEFEELGSRAFELGRKDFLHVLERYIGLAENNAPRHPRRLLFRPELVNGFEAEFLEDLFEHLD